MTIFNNIAKQQSGIYAGFSLVPGLSPGGFLIGRSLHRHSRTIYLLFIVCARSFENNWSWLVALVTDGLNVNKGAWVQSVLFCDIVLALIVPHPSRGSE